MQKYAVGERINKFETGQEAVYFDMDDGGAKLVILFNSPNEQEINGISKGALEFGLFEMEGIIFVLIKPDGMPWMDAPYVAHLSKNLTTLQEIECGQGYGCTIILADSSTGKIKALRLVGLGTTLSRWLKNNIEWQLKREFDRKEYERALASATEKYSSEDMAKFSTVNFKIK